MAAAWVVAAKLEGSSELPGYPDTQYGGALSYGVTDFATVTVEYLHGMFDVTDTHSDALTAQLGLEF